MPKEFGQERCPAASVSAVALIRVRAMGPVLIPPAVTAALKDNDPAVRREAILALVKFGAAAKEAAPILTEMRRNDRDAQVRSHAAKALESLERTK